MTARIPLRARDGSVRAWTLVDHADYQQLAFWKWSLQTPGNYAYRLASRLLDPARGWDDGNVVRAKVFLHRVVLMLTEHDRYQVDHINGDPLDNRKANLRIVTPAQQAQNKRGGTGHSRFRGVSLDRRESLRKRWTAQVQLDGVRHYLGRYETEEEAEAACIAFRRKHMPFSADAPTVARELVAQ